VRAVFEELVYRTALALDAGEFAAYLGLCAPDFRYSAGAYSPEIRREMLWLDHDREGLANLFATLPRHHSDRAPLSRHVTVYTVDLAAAGDQARMDSSLLVFRTTLDGGSSELFAVGKIHDTARLVGGGALLVRRHIQLQTRQLGIGSHIPF
jgi:methanesulfonate monooxygenase small subunit